MITDTLKLYRNWFKATLLCYTMPAKKHHNEKSFVLIASHLPPNSGGGVFRPLSFLQNAPSNEWACDAFCLDYKVENFDAGNFLAQKIPKESTSVTRVRLNQLKPSWLLSPRIDGGFNNALNLFFAVINKIKYKPHIIFATGPSFSSFLTGYYLSKYYRSPLILDYRDEWTLCPFSWIEKDQLNKYFERKCCSHARKILFTTKSHLVNHSDAFPDIPAEKRIVIANGYEAGDFITNENIEQIEKNKKFVLSFIGNLSQHSSPEVFLKNLELSLEIEPTLSENIEIIFAGNKSPDALSLIENFKFNEIIKTVNHLAKNEAVSLMTQSDALLILAGKGMSSYIPGKLFDYLAAKKPILYYGEMGEATAIINSLNAGYAVSPDNGNDLSLAIRKLINKDLIIDEVKVNDWLKSFDRSFLANKLFNIFNQFF